MYIRKTGDGDAQRRIQNVISSRVAAGRSSQSLMKEIFILSPVRGWTPIFSVATIISRLWRFRILYHHRAAGLRSHGDREWNIKKTINGKKSFLKTTAGMKTICVFSFWNVVMCRCFLKRSREKSDAEAAYFKIHLLPSLCGDAELRTFCLLFFLECDHRRRFSYRCREG